MHDFSESHLSRIISTLNESCGLCRGASSLLPSFEQPPVTYATFINGLLVPDLTLFKSEDVVDTVKQIKYVLMGSNIKALLAEFFLST